MSTARGVPTGSCESHSANQDRRAPNSPQGRTPLVLTIDDDPDICRIIELRLSPYDVSVERASYGTQGLLESILLKPDVIIMDLVMPNGNGHYVLECLRRDERSASIPVIVLTGMRDPVFRARSLAAGANVFLTKPVGFDQLLGHMGRFIDVRKRPATEGVSTPTKSRAG
jgi:DNA-binding response OmpR family regulator